MKILVTSIVDLKKSQHNRPHQFIEYLSKNHELTVISINDWWKGSQGDLKNYSKDFDEVYNRIEYIHLTERKISPFIQELCSAPRIKKLIKGKTFDVHLNYSTFVSGLTVSGKINTVYDLADDQSSMIRASPQIPRVLRPIGGAFGDYMIRKNVRSSCKTTLSTENLRKTYDIPEERSVIIPNGVNSKQFYDYGPVAKEELGWNGFILGYVGVLREWIDFEPVFSALSDLDKSIKVVIVGKEGRFEETVQLAKRYGVDDRVIFTGMIPYSQVPKYISAMDVCLMPFKKDAISENAVPLKMFEYMACGKPIVSTRLNAVEKIVGNKILYSSGKDDIKNLINQLFQDDTLKRRMGHEGRKFVEEQYDWSRQSERMEKVLLAASV
jgi:glycosyltransferase involved in cell wall biosynthesis